VPQFRPGAQTPYQAYATFDDITARKLAEDRLRESEERYELAAAGANDGIWDWDMVTGAAHMSPRYKEMLGYADDELDNTHEMWESLLHPDDRETAIATIHTLQTGEISEFELEYRLRHKDGGYRWILDRGKAVRDEQGRPHRAAGSHTDITEHKHSQAALVRAAEEWRRTFDAVPDLIALLDLEHGITRVNRAMAERLGLAPEDAVGLRCCEAVHGLREAPPFCPHQRLLATGEPQREEVEEPNLGGRFDVTVTPLRDADGTLLGSVHVARDITEAKQAEEALRTSETRYAAFIDATDDLVFIKDEQLRYLVVNQANADFFGRPATDIVGLTDGDLMPPDAAAGCRRSDLAALERDETVIDEEPVGDRIYEVRKFPVALDGGRVGVGGYARDITEPRAAQAALTQAFADIAAGAERLQTTLHDTVKAMGEIVGLRDPYTARHEKSVTRLAMAIAEDLGLDEQTREGLMLAGEVHDIGKICVPAEILSKPAALTGMEYRLVQQHAQTGREILSGITFQQPVAEIVGQHHERLDGSGYPDGVSGDQIRIEARILAVADVIEAMASHRPYRPALGMEAALAEVRAGAGTVYDADVAAACERVIAAGFALEDPDKGR